MTHHRIHIYHINDLHSHFQNWGKIKRTLQNRRRIHEEQGESVYVVDIGDFIDRYHPLTEATKGKAQVQMMNELNLLAATIGNNEGVALNKGDLLELYTEAIFPIILNNIIDPTTGRIPKFAQPNLIVTDSCGFTFGILGYTAPYELSYYPQGWAIDSLAETLNDDIANLKDKVDAIIVLSHLGLPTDEWIAAHYPEVKVIFGGHTHHVLVEGLEINDCLVTGAGKYGQFVGHVELEINLPSLTLVKKTADIIDMAAIEAIPEDQSNQEKLWRDGEDLLEQVPIADIPNDYEMEWQSDSLMLQLGLDAITDYTDCQIGVLTGGLFLTPIHQGLFTRKELHQLLPHPMRILKVTMLGKHFKELLLNFESQRDSLLDYPIQGMGFRGEIFGYIGYKGIQIDHETSAITILGKPLDEDQRYHFATVDHYRFIPNFPEIERYGKIDMLFPYFFRDVFAQYLGKAFPLK